MSLQQLRSDVMARYPGYQVEPSEPAPTKPISLGLANFQQAKPEQEDNSRGLAHMPGTNSGGETFPKLPSLRADRFEPSNTPSLLRTGQLPPEWHRLVSDQGRITPETVSFTRGGGEFSELQSSLSKILAVLSDLDWWIAGVSNLIKYMQPHLSHNESLQLAGTYSQRYLLESCRSMEELEIQVTALLSQLKLRERDGYLSRLHSHVPVATRRDLRVSPLVGEFIFDEELVSQAGTRLQGDVSLKSITIMLDSLAKGQGQRIRAPPQPKRPAPALPPLVSTKRPKQNPQPTGRGGGNKGKGQFSGQSAKRGKGRGAKGSGRL